MSRMLRRSGIAFVTMADFIDWHPDFIIQVGVGLHHEESKIFKIKWPNVHLIGFEANPDINKSIKETYPGKLFPFAVTDGSTETIDLFYKKAHKDGSSIYPHKTDETQKVTVPTISLDNWAQENLKCEDYSNILLWLDCEGSELIALEGASHYLLDKVGAINIELTSKPTREGWCDPCEVHTFLNACGFLRQRVHSNRSSLGQADSIYVRHEFYKPEHSVCPCQTQIYWEGIYDKKQASKKN